MIVWIRRPVKPFFGRMGASKGCILVALPSIAFGWRTAPECGASFRFNVRCGGGVMAAKRARLIQMFGPAPAGRRLRPAQRLVQLCEVADCLGQAADCKQRLAEFDKADTERKPAQPPR